MCMIKSPANLSMRPFLREIGAIFYNFPKEK